MKTDFQNEIIRRLKVARESHRLSQANVADNLGISYGQMGNIESPKQNHKYTLAQIYALCKLLGIPIEDVFLTPKEKTGNVIDKLVNNIIAYEKQ